MWVSNNTICNSSRHTYNYNMVAWHKPLTLKSPTRTTQAEWVQGELVREKVRCSWFLLLLLVHVRGALVQTEEPRPGPRSEQHLECEHHEALVYNSKPLKGWENYREMKVFLWKKWFRRIKSKGIWTRRYERTYYSWHYLSSTQNLVRV